jgi:hypothetical protein
VNLLRFWDAVTDPDTASLAVELLTVIALNQESIEAHAIPALSEFTVYARLCARKPEQIAAVAGVLCEIAYALALCRAEATGETTPDVLAKIGLSYAELGQ